MRLRDLVQVASNKENFTEMKHYAEFCRAWLDFIGTPGRLQAEIVSRNETARFGQIHLSKEVDEQPFVF